MKGRNECFIYFTHEGRPHKSQQYLFIVFLPLYSTAEQMILNKGLLSPPQAEQASLSKDKIGETLQKWQVQQIKIKQ